MPAADPSLASRAVAVGGDLALLPDGVVHGANPYRAATMLAVEDSRFAAEAMRLMCRKLGIRLRRAEDLRSAHQHLHLYRPDIVLIDLGLPDGRGEALIRDLVASPWRPRAVLATSGDPAGRGTALAAGADGFIDKPLENLASFRAVLIRQMPDLAQAPPLSDFAPPQDDAPIHPDPLALRDDLAHAASVLRDRDDPAGRSYVAGFLGGVARHAHDAALAAAAEDAGRAPLDKSSQRLQGMLQRRLAAPDDAFRGTLP